VIIGVNIFYINKIINMEINILQFLYSPPKKSAFFIRSLLKEITSTVWQTFSKQLANVVSFVAYLGFDF